MKALVILFGLVALAGALLPKDDFGEIDMSEYNNNAKLKDLFTCIIGKGPCTNLENNLKDRFSDIVETDCGYCSLRETEIVAYVINRIAQVNSSDLYELLKVKDPTGINSKYFLNFVQHVSMQLGYPKLSGDIFNGLPDSS